MFIVLRFLRKTKKIIKIKSWIYGLAMPSSFLTGWAFLGMSESFIKTDLTFISFYFGIILFSPILPFLIEKINRLIIQKDINDIVSFLHKNFCSDKFIKILTLIIISTIGIVYCFINVKTLFLLFGENIYIFGLSIIIILIFIFTLKDWDVITSVAFQGIIMIVSFLIIGIFLISKHFNSIGDLFNTILKNDPQKLIVNNTDILSQWNINIITTLFAYLFLPRQFSILVQARDLTSKEKSTKIILASTIFFLIYVLINLIISSVFYLKVGNIDIKILDFIKEYGIVINVIFLISGLSFILSTFNQQVVAFSKIFENNINLNKYIPLSIFFIFIFLMFPLMENIYISQLGTFCFSSLFTLIIPILFIILSRNSEKLINPTRFSLLFSFISILLMFISLISDPNNFTIQKYENSFIQFIRSISINNNYFFSLFLYPNLLSIIFFGLELYSIKKAANVNKVYSQIDYLTIIDKISRFFDYNFYLISLFAFFYNNRNSEFTILEIKELYPIENIEKNIDILIKKGVIKESKFGIDSFKYNNSFLIPDINVKNLAEFIKTFLFTRSLLVSVENDFKKEKEVYKEKIDIMNKAYKAYIKLSRIKNTKTLIKNMSKVLPYVDSNLLKIEYIKNKKAKVLYQSHYFSNESTIFPINIGKNRTINIYLDTPASTELWFYLEPIIHSFYKNAKYIDKIKKYLIKIQALEKIKSFLLSNISHEIRTPLTPIKGYISFLKTCDIVKKEELKEALDTMEESYKRLEKIINNITEIKNINIEEKIKSNINEVISIKNLLDVVINDNINNINKKNIELINNLNDTKNEKKVLGDFRKLRIALNAILDNAIKFNRDNGKIFIDTFEKNDFIVIKIEDTGIGMSRDDIKKAFEIFFQKELNDKKRYEGLGLGLSIAKEVLKKLNGKIKIKSKENKGTKVYIYLKKP